MKMNFGRSKKEENRIPKLMSKYVIKETHGAFETVEELSRVLKKPQSHFKIDYITIIATRDSFNNIISKEVI